MQNVIWQSMYFQEFPERVQTVMFRQEILIYRRREIRDILYCSRHYKKFVLVLNVGGMVNLEPVMEVKNILLLGQLGTPTGDVLADILTGVSNPSGKLAMTWAPIEQYPSTKGFGDMDDTVYNEGLCRISLF